MTKGLREYLLAYLCCLSNTVTIIAELYELCNLDKSKPQPLRYF